MAGWFKGTLLVVLIAGYALASHFSLILPNGRAVAAALAVGVPAVAVGVFIFQWVAGRLARLAPDAHEARRSDPAVRWSAAGLVAVVPIATFLWLVWPLILVNAQALYFAQHVGTNALLAWVFGHTLAGGSTPLVVTFARMVHPDLPPEIEAYARKVTFAWTVFFLLTCAISVVLFIAAPLAVWSAFAVLLQWPSVAVFFVGEYLLRRRLFSQFDHASLKQGFDAYNQHQSRASPPAGVSKP
jgi:uncharacterized membrane protein